MQNTATDIQQPTSQLDNEVGPVAPNTLNTQLDEVPGILGKGSLDDNLESVRRNLEKQYPIGNCVAHKTIHCVIHRPSGQHFDLMEGRSLVWGKLILDKKSNYFNPPVGEMLWKKEHALKKVMGSAPQPLPEAPTAPIPATPAAPTTSLPATPQPQQTAAMTAMNPYAPFGMPMPMFNPFTMGLAGALATPTTPMNLPQMQMQMQSVQRGTTPAASGSRKRPRHDIRSSSPVMDFEELISLDDFCNEYHLDDQIREGLKKMQFLVGDDLSIVTLTDIRDAGLTPLSWGRVKRAHKAFMKSLPPN
ncbi:hypothetical protein SCHPADRAFT_948071 [Schizopora paradoxa]|uniref:Uncharacterized protein n=1 Tax=Schizopora paradoxa TaxID=27342 RepID=A0A0H2QWR8_9AGAM|nr:hypothetical protein SCHPADRAFT_948071 [Schizopora paradoxa]